MSVYFLRKDFEQKNANQAKINLQNKYKRRLNNKSSNFSRRKPSKRVEIVCFRFLYTSIAQNLFLKKIDLKLS